MYEAAAIQVCVEYKHCILLNKGVIWWNPEPNIIY